MNTKSLLIAALATVFTGAAIATGKSPAELQQEAQLHAPSITTRAAVLAEVLKARAAGTLDVHPDRSPHGSGTYSASTLTRAEVQAQLAQALADGTLNLQPDGASGFGVAARAPRVRAVSRMANAKVAADVERLSQGDANRNSPSVHITHAERARLLAEMRNAAAAK